MYRKELNQRIDAAVKYKVNHVTLQKNLVSKSKLTMKTIFYCHPIKWLAYEGTRVLIFDKTNVYGKKSSDAEVKQTNYSSMHYGKHVEKGAFLCSHVD